MKKKTEEISFQGRIYRPVNILATGQYQLMRMESLKCYILVSPDGRQAWIHDEQIKDIQAKNPKFRFTSNPLRDLNKLFGLGLQPFHTDSDYVVPTVLDNRTLN